MKNNIELGLGGSVWMNFWGTYKRWKNSKYDLEALSQQVLSKIVASYDVL